MGKQSIKNIFKQDNPEEVNMNNIVTDARQRKIERNNPSPHTESSGEQAIQDNFVGTPSEIARAKKIVRNAHSVYLKDGDIVPEHML